MSFLSCIAGLRKDKMVKSKCKKDNFLANGKNINEFVIINLINQFITVVFKSIFQIYNINRRESKNVNLTFKINKNQTF